jgi:hypothetical protein
MEKPKSAGKYTCNEYREEMILVGLQKRLSASGVTPEEKKDLLREIAKVEKQMGID